MRIALIIILSFISIYSQQLTIYSPQSGASYYGSDEILIEWNSTFGSGAIELITLKYKKADNTSSWQTIDKVGVNEGSYEWILSNELMQYDGKLKIRISSVSNSSVWDEVTIGDDSNYTKSSSKSSSISKKTSNKYYKNIEVRNQKDLGLVVDKFYPNIRSYVSVYWNKAEPIDLYYKKDNENFYFIKRYSYYQNNYRLYLFDDDANKKITFLIRNKNKDYEYIDIKVKDESVVPYSSSNNTGNVNSSSNNTGNVNSSSNNTGNVTNFEALSCIVIIFMVLSSVLEDG